MQNYALDTITTTDALIHVADYAGSPFWSPRTLRFFKSRTLNTLYTPDGIQAKPGNRFVFVTSEVYENNPRFYIVRQLTLTHNNQGQPRVEIDTVSSYLTASQAKTAAKNHAEKLKNETPIQP